MRPKVVMIGEWATLDLHVWRERLGSGATVYVAQCARRRACMAHGDTVEEAVANLEQSRALYDDDTPAAGDRDTVAGAVDTRPRGAA